MKRVALSPLPIAALAIFALAGCTSTQDILRPSALTPVEPATSTSAGNVTGNPLSGAPVAAVTVPTRIHFAPVVGATAAAATPLNARLSERAREMGIELTAEGDDATTHVMKGYFSAISESGQTTVIYVWDVLDPAGNRLHRIQGQQHVPASGAGGWASVQPATMEAIADQTIGQFAAWISTRAG